MEFVRYGLRVTINTTLDARSKMGTKLKVKSFYHLKDFMIDVPKIFFVAYLNHGNIYALNNQLFR